jgi:hypothetical protein
MEKYARKDMIKQWIMVKNQYVKHFQSLFLRADRQSINTQKDIASGRLKIAQAEEYIANLFAYNCYADKLYMLNKKKSGFFDDRPKILINVKNIDIKDTKESWERYDRALEPYTVLKRSTKELIYGKDHPKSKLDNTTLAIYENSTTVFGYIRSQITLHRKAKDNRVHWHTALNYAQKFQEVLSNLSHHPYFELPIEEDASKWQEQIPIAIRIIKTKMNDDLDEKTLTTEDQKLVTLDYKYLNNGIKKLHNKKIDTSELVDSYLLWNFA